MAELPRPTTTIEFYLAAILAELRALRAEIGQLREATLRPVAAAAAPPAEVALLAGPGHRVEAPPAKRARRRQKPGG